jgi:hypothetical protein
MDLNYSTLFTIEILHEYFLNRRSKDIQILPANDCVVVSQRMNIQFRQRDNRFLAFIRENNDHEPYLNSADNKSYRKYYQKTIFRFYLKIDDPTFYNYSNLNLSYGLNRKFYFSNLAKNKRSGNLYLSVPVHEYNPGSNYVPGDLVKDANGNVFEAIKKISSGKKSKLTDTSLWAPKGLLHLTKPIEDHTAGKTYASGNLVKEPGTNNVFEALKKHASGDANDLKDASLWTSKGQGQLQYPTDNDLVDCCGENYLFKVATPVTKAEITISRFNFDPQKPEYNAPAKENETKNFQNPVSQIPISFSKLNPGKYEIKVNDESKMVYYDPALKAGNILGVIEIFNYLPGSDDYSLLADDEKLKDTTYQIQFANRRVLWKYIRKDGKAKSITDMGETGYVFKLNGEEFVSVIPIPLSEGVVKTLKLEFNSKDFNIHPLANPRTDYLRKFHQNDYDYLCSEVYLNY